MNPSLSQRVAWGLLAALLLGGCTSPPQARRSFMGTASTRPMDNEVAVGLNPLGSLDVCRDALKPLALGNRVLVSRPEAFSRDASQMIVELRQALGEPAADDPPVQLMLSAHIIASDDQALAEGRDCGALLVLWEPAGAMSLATAFPFPAQIPLRGYDLRPLCTLGNFYQRVNVLYYTILGTANIMNNRFERARRNLQLAAMIDMECLKLPAQ